MTSGPTLPLWIGRSKFLFPTVSVAVLLLAFASIRGPRCVVKRAGPGRPRRHGGAGRIFQKGRGRWVYYCCVRCKIMTGMAYLRRRLILKPGEAFLASQHVQNLKYTRRCRSARQRRPQRLGDRAELETIFLGKGAQRGLGGGAAPRLDFLQ